LDVVSQGDEEAHEALDGVAIEFKVQQGGDFRLRDAEGRRDFGLGEALLLDDAADGGSETGFGLASGRLRSANTLQVEGVT
jgi:hypothetical protein